MKTQLTLLAGALTGLALIATPALSQQTPTSPRTAPPSRSTGMGMQSDFHQAVNALVGTWDVTVRTWSPENAPKETPGMNSPTTPGSRTPGSTTPGSATPGSSTPGSTTPGMSSSPSQSSNQNAANEIHGTSTRQWTLDNHVLVEQVQTNEKPTLGASNQNAAGQFEGHGMFGYNDRGNQFEHVWADSTSSQLTCSTGDYDSSTKTFTFTPRNIGSGMPMHRTPGYERPGTTPRPGMSPGTSPRPGTTPGSPDLGAMSDEPQANPSSPSQTPSQSYPGMQRSTTGEKINSLNDVQKIVIRIIDDNHHVVEYFANNAQGEQVKLMEINYTKSGAGRSTS